MKLLSNKKHLLRRTTLLLGLLFLQIVGFGQVNITPTHTGTIISFGSWTHISCVQAVVGGNDYVKMVNTLSKVESPVMDFSSFSSMTLDFKAGSFGTVTNPKKTITVSISINNGSSWTVIGTRIPPSSTISSVSQFDLSSFTTTQVIVRIESLGADGSNGVRLDDIDIQGVVPAGPALVVSPTTLTGFSYFVGSGPSTSQSYNLSGTLLTGFPSNITVTAPTNYEVSLNNAAFSASVLVPYTTATLASTPIYVRLKAGLLVGAYNGEIITNAGGGATTQNVTCSGDVIGSSTSDIITANGESATIPSTINTAGPLTSVQGTQVWQFTIRDGGASSPDADNLSTIVNSIIFSQAAGNAVADWSTAIKAIDLFDGATNVGSGVVTTGPNAVTFSGLNINVADNSTKTISVRLTLNCGIGSANFDGEDFGFQISNGNVTFSIAGSGKSSFSAISTTNGQNVINIVATKLVFTQQPTTTAQGQIMAPSVLVSATDACNNVDIDFTGTISVTSTGTMTSSPQTAAAVAGVATFNTINHSVTGTGFTLSATTGGLTGATSTTFDINTVTVFKGGDMAIVGMCVNMNGCSGVTTSGLDEISIVTFVDIIPGTSFYLTDNGFERKNCGSNTWGDGEGVVQITRTNTTVAAGTIITFRIMNNSDFSCTSPDNNWSIAYTVGTNFNLNSNDEQVYLMQGGIWTDGGAASDATYSNGTFMFAINTYTAWTCNDDNSQRGDLPLPLKCFNILAPSGSENVKYTGITTPTTQRNWLDRLNDQTNWTAMNGCAAYTSQSPDYSIGYNFVINAGGFSSGQWTGSVSTDWFDCNNWQNFTVPDSLINVNIDNEVNDPIIGASPVTYPNGAICNDLLITNTSGSGVLTLNNALSYFSIKGNITNNGIITGTNGLTELRSTNAQSFSGSGSTQFYNLRLNNTNASGISLSQDVTVSNNLTFTNGMLSTGTNKLIITNTTVPTIFGYGNTKFINGNLRHHIANNTSTYDFPIGDGMATTNYKRFDLINNSLVTTTYIDASVANVPQGTPVADVDANLGALAVQWGTQLTNVLNSAVWTLIPNAQPTSGTYGVNLYVENVAGLSGADDNMFCPVKRDASSVTYADWSTYLAAPTVIPATGLAGRLYSGGVGYAQRTGYQNFSLHAIAKAPTILPIKLLYFTANKNGRVVDLDWATTTEINNDYFTIERSKDAINFEPIFFKKGAGNSSMNLYYSTIDKSPLSGVSYYRLKQTDFDGKYTYSNIESVVFDGAKGLEIVNTYHSVDNNLLTIKVNSGENSAVNFELYDMTGKLVHQSLETLKGENQTVLLPTAQFSSGIYLLKVFNNAEVITQKVKF